MITALPAEIPNVPDERTYAATLPTGDESGAPAAHGDIAGIGSSDMAQAAVPLTSDGPLHSLALTIVTLVIGALGFFVGWYLLRRPGRGPHGRSRSLAIAGWAALGMIADSFLILWLLVWLGGPYWLHPLLWLLTVVPVAIVCAAAARKEGACT
ncbi:hypothetical protein [Streptomyces sp. NPDC090022]|uniref:hypothetical protein n=1 Tax=Streptomyces sp. NPDC090022 TaxID=3365920 RepID=UPI0038192B8F